MKGKDAYFFLSFIFFNVKVYTWFNIDIYVYIYLIYVYILKWLQQPS